MGKVWSFTIPPLGPPQPPLVTVMYGLFPRETFPPTFLLEIGPGIFQVYTLGTSPLPQTLKMLHNNILQINLIFSQHLKRAPGVLCLGTLTSPMENPPNQPTFEYRFFFGEFCHVF